MATSIVFKGTTYSIPNSVGESGWATSLTQYLQALASGAAVNSIVKQTSRVATASPITVQAATDFTVVCKLTSPGAVAVNLPAGGTGQMFCIVDGTGDAATNNITVDGSAAETINGSATYVIKSNYGGVILHWNGTQWNVVGQINPAASDVSNVPSGNLAATNVQSALDELQTDVDTRATSASLTAHTGASTGVHGATGAVVGTTDTQNLSNKTLVGAKVGDYEDFIENSSAPATPASGYVRVYAKNDNKLYKKDDTGVESAIGSGGSGGINLIDNPDDVTGWTNSGLSSLTTITGSNNPLNTVTDTAISIVADTIADYASYSFVVPAALANTPLVVSHITNTASGSFKVQVFADATEVALSSSTISAGQGQFRAFFVPVSTATNHSVRVTCLATGTIYVAAVTVGPQSLSTGAAVGDWQSYTPVLTGVGAKVFTSTGKWRRVGDHMEVRLALLGDATAAGASGTSFTASMPAGFSIDATKVPYSGGLNDGSNTLGVWEEFGIGADATFNYATSAVSPGGPSTVILFKAAGANVVQSDFNAARVMQIYAQFSAPIVGWSSNVTMADRAVEEYAADDGTSDVFGPNGAPVPNVAFGAGITARDFAFQNPKQVTDELLLDYNVLGQGWAAQNGLFSFVTGNNGNSSNQYGVRGYWASPTIYRVEFGNRGNEVADTLTDNGNGSWASRFAAGDRFRVRKVSGGAAVGYPIDRANLTYAGVGNGLFYEEGSFTATLTGCTTSPTSSCRWVRVGKQVTLIIGSVTGTSNSISCGLTGLPTSIYPVVQINSAQRVANNSADVTALLEITTAGAINLYPLIGGGEFVTSGIKGLAGTTHISYIIA